MCSGPSPLLSQPPGCLVEGVRGVCPRWSQAEREQAAYTGHAQDSKHRHVPSLAGKLASHWEKLGAVPSVQTRLQPRAALPWYLGHANVPGSHLHAPYGWARLRSSLAPVGWGAAAVSRSAGPRPICLHERTQRRPQRKHSERFPEVPHHSRGIKCDDVAVQGAHKNHLRIMWESCANQRTVTWPSRVACVAITW